MYCIQHTRVCEFTNPGFPLSNSANDDLVRKRVQESEKRKRGWVSLCLITMCDRMCMTGCVSVSVCSVFLCVWPDSRENCACLSSLKCLTAYTCKYISVRYMWSMFKRT